MSASSWNMVKIDGCHTCNAQFAQYLVTEVIIVHTYLHRRSHAARRSCRHLHRHIRSGLWRPDLSGPNVPRLLFLSQTISSPIELSLLLLSTTVPKDGIFSRSFEHSPQDDDSAGSLIFGRGSYRRVPGSYAWKQMTGPSFPFQCETTPPRNTEVNDQFPHLASVCLLQSARSEAVPKGQGRTNVTVIIPPYIVYGMNTIIWLCT